MPPSLGLSSPPAPSKGRKRLEDPPLTGCIPTRPASSQPQHHRMEAQDGEVPQPILSPTHDPGLPSRELAWQRQEVKPAAPHSLGPSAHLGPLPTLALLRGSCDQTREASL